MGNEGFVAARVRERGRIFMRVMGQCNLKYRFKPKLIHRAVLYVHLCTQQGVRSKSSSLNPIIAVLTALISANKTERSLTYALFIN